MTGKSCGTFYPRMQCMAKVSEMYVRHCGTARLLINPTLINYERCIKNHPYNKYDNYIDNTINMPYIINRGSAVVSTSARHAGGPGSRPGPGTLLGVKTWLSTLEIVYL